MKSAGKKLEDALGTCVTYAFGAAVVIACLAVSWRLIKWALAP